MQRKPSHRLTAMLAATFTLVFTVAFSIPAAAAGSPWQTVSGATLPANTYPETLGVTMIATNDVWAVGDVADASGQRTLAEHWNGTQWSVVSHPTTTSFGGVAAVSSRDVWAVGSLIEHWNGTQWSVVPSPNTSNTSTNPINTLNSVAIVAPNDVWAVGLHTSKDSSGITHETTLTEQWNGTAWSRVPSPTLADDSAYDTLIGVAAVPSGTLWAMPQRGTFRGDFLRNTTG